MMKRLPGRLSVVGAMLLVAVSVCKMWQCGSTKKNYEYTVNNGTITITKYIGPNNVATIPDTINDWPVTSIGTNAFSECNRLISVIIGTNVTSIGGEAFQKCTNLSGVIIPNGVANIGRGAFFACPRLASITIPDSVVSIGDYAFEDCGRLTKVMISSNMTSIGEGIFNGCARLPRITIPSSVTSIGERAFGCCRNLTGITIPASVTNIGLYVFSQCANLTAITVDEHNPVYSSIDGALFNKSQTTLILCPGGKTGSYAISNRVTSIGNDAFCFCCKLTDITIPASVTNIESRTFHCCDVTGVYFLGNAPAIDSDVFSGADNPTVYYLPGTTGWGPAFGGHPAVLWANAPGH